jgi:4-amino-4-deoxy-L-arabinose transferase-like glycosyltransferase
MILRNRLAWLRTRIPECAVLVLGVFLRMTMRWSYRPAWGFDSSGHFEYIDWILKHRAVPPADAFFHAFHPPLFYSIAAAIAGENRTTAVWISIFFGTLRLGVIWAGLEICFPQQRWARLSALALAAVIPASVHTDGLVYGEPLNGFLIAAAMLVTLIAFRRPARSRWRWTTLLGVIFGLAMLTKISAVIILIGIGIAALSEFVLSVHSDWRTRWENLLPWSATLLVCIALCGWYYVPIAQKYGRPFITSFDTFHTDPAWDPQGKPPIERRTFGFVVGWNRDIYQVPYWPTAALPYSRFFPLVLTSTFVDYWNFSFSGLSPERPAELSANNRPLTRKLMNVSRLSVIGGTFIALATSIAFAACLRYGLRRRRWDIMALLFGAGLTVLSALYFALQYPCDNNGVIKGNYLLFGAPPLYAMFGVAVAWAQRKPSRWILLVGLLGSLYLVASYTLYCRTRIWLPPAMLM